VPVDFSRLRGLVLGNGGLKALSLLLAVLCYYAIRGATSYEVPYEVPLEVKVEPGVALLDRDVESVLVTFRGSQEDLRQIDPKRLKAVVRPRASLPNGFETVSVSPADIEGAARGTHVTRIWPRAVKVTFDHEVEKIVMVEKPQTVGRPLMGTAEVSYEPRVATIRGPQRRLELAGSVLTESVDVDGRMASFTRRVRVLTDPMVSVVNPAEILVKVDIVAETVTRTWTNVPVRAFLGPGEAVNVRFEPPTAHVFLKGRAEVLQALPADAVRVFADCASGAAAVSGSLPLNVYLPPGVDVNVRVEPEAVQAIVARP
jgi:hypothetical protein